MLKRAQLTVHSWAVAALLLAGCAGSVADHLDGDGQLQALGPGTAMASGYDAGGTAPTRVFGLGLCLGSGEPVVLRSAAALHLDGAMDVKAFGVQRAQRTSDPGAPDTLLGSQEGSLDDGRFEDVEGFIVDVPCGTSTVVIELGLEYTFGAAGGWLVGIGVTYETADGTVHRLLIDQSIIGCGDREPPEGYDVCEG